MDQGNTDDQQDNMFFTNGLRGLESQIAKEIEEKQQQAQAVFKPRKPEKKAKVQCDDQEGHDKDNADLGSLDGDSQELYSISSIMNVDESHCSMGQQNSIFKIDKKNKVNNLMTNMYFLPTNERQRRLKYRESKLGGSPSAGQKDANCQTPNQ